MSERHKRSEAAEKAFVKDLKARKWKKREIDAALGGWEWVLDNTCHHTDDRYDIKQLQSSGQDEAYDMADSLVQFGDDRWKPREKEAAADYIYEGIVAAKKFVRSEPSGVTSAGTYHPVVGFPTSRAIGQKKLSGKPSSTRSTRSSHG